MKNQDGDDMTKEDLLEMLGFEPKRSTRSWLLGALGTFATGAIIGAGVAMLFAPKPGAELRQDIRRKVRRGKDGVGDLVQDVSAKASEAHDSI